MAKTRKTPKLPRKRARDVCVDRTFVRRLCTLKTGQQFSRRQLQEIIQLIATEEEAKVIEELLEKELKGVLKMHRLHGCAKCDDFIWMHKETILCPNCNSSEGRYDADGKPRQEVFYFELLPRLRRMYCDPAWRRALEYPETRPL